MRISMPAWWKPWYAAQLVQLGILALNLFMVFECPSPMSLLNWIGVGACGTIIAVTPIFYRQHDCIKLQQQQLEQQHEMITHVMTMKTSEIGATIAAQIKEDFGGDVVVETGPRLTKH